MRNDSKLIRYVEILLPGAAFFGDRREPVEHTM